jgi:hypothetical protein
MVQMFVHTCITKGRLNLLFITRNLEAIYFGQTIRNIIDNTGQQNFAYFLSHEEKCLILIVLLTLNSNM